MAQGETDDERRAYPVLHVTAPLVVLGATWLARKVLNTAYERATGHTPPVPDDPRVSFGRALAWTLVAAGSAAVIEMVIYRAASKMVPEN